MPDNFNGGTFLRAQFAEQRTLFALRVGEKDDNQVRSLLYRIELAADLSERPDVEIIMDYEGWLTDFWRHPSKTFFMGDVDGELYIVDPSDFRGAQPQERGITQIFGRALDDVYAVAISGMVLHWNGEDWSSVGPKNTEALFAIGEMADGRIVVAGEMGRAFVQSRDGWQQLELPTNVRLTGIGRMQGATFIGGEKGVCYRLDAQLSITGIPGPNLGTYGFADFAGRGYSASQADGLMLLDGEELTATATPLQPYGVTVLGDLLAAYGDDKIAVFDGHRWTPVDVDA